MMKVRIGIDLMGGDNSPQVVWGVLIKILSSRELSSQFSFIAFATEEVRKKILSHCAHAQSLEIVTAEDFVDMNDTPLSSVRKKSSSMAVGLDYLCNDQIDAFITTGNTAALITLSRTKIPVFPTVRRPALLVRVPTMRGYSVILDVGANVSVNPEEMLGFARMGLAYRQCLDNEQRRFTVGLLNIGSEERKGTQTYRQTFRLLKETFQDDFLGNVESGDVFRGNADIVVADGFTGNIFLKTAEGVFDFLRQILGEKLEIDVKDKLDYTIYPGSMVCGLSKLVIKCHGSASEQSLFNGISGSIDLARADICRRILDGLI